MAAASEDGIKSKISEEMLNCQICFDSYTEPKSLPCLHTFCKGCLETYIRKQSGRRDSDYVCPICRNDFSLSRDGVDGLPTNFIYNNLAELLGQGKKENEKAKEMFCESCFTAGDKPAVAKCNECDEMLCAECVDAHSRVKLTRDHVMTPLHDNNAVLEADPTLDKGSDLKAMTKEWFCENHQSEKVTCICLQCVLPLCPFCISDILTSKSHKHKKHDIVGLEEAKARFLEQMETSSDQLRERITDVEDGINTLEETENMLTESAEQTKKEVEARSKEIKASVDRWRTKILKDIESENQRSKSDLSGKKQLLESYLQKLEDGTKEINELMRSGDSDVVLQKEELNSKIQVLQMSTVFDHNQLPQPVKLSLTGPEGGSLTGPEGGGDVKSKIPALLGRLNIEKTARLQRFDSMSSLSSLASAGGETGASKQPRLKVNTSIHIRVLTTYRVNDVTMVGMAIGRVSGDFFAVDSKNREIYHFNLNDENRFKLLHKYGAKRLKEPLDVDQLPDGRIIVSDGKEGHSVKIFIPGSGKIDDNVGHLFLKKACGIAATPNNGIIVTDVDAQTIYCLKSELDKFKEGWKIVEHKGKKQFDSPQYVACGKNGEVVVTDRMKSQAKAFHPEGRFKFNYGRFGTKRAQMRKPEGVCIDQEGRIYIADVHNKKIHILHHRGGLLGYIDVPKVCGKFDPMPTMVAITKNGHLMLGNDQGWLKILEVTMTTGGVNV